MLDKLVYSMPSWVQDTLKGWVGKSVFLKRGFEVAKSMLSRRVGRIRTGPGEGLKIQHFGERLAHLSGEALREEQAFLSRHVSEGDVVYDIGANIGFLTTITARLTGPEGQVYAFEPIPSTAAMVKENASHNGFEHVTVFEWALSSENGPARMESEGEHTETYSVGEEGRVQVTRRRLNDVVTEQNMKMPDLMKIDVEGHELQVLEGALDTIRTAKPLLLIEVHSLGQAFVDFCEETLKPMGYTLTRLDGTDLPAGTERYHAFGNPTRNRPVS